MMLPPKSPWHLCSVVEPWPDRPFPDSSSLASNWLTLLSKYIKCMDRTWIKLFVPILPSLAAFGIRVILTSWDTLWETGTNLSLNVW